MSEETDIFLNVTWSLYFHDPDNSNWGIESYILISTISSVHDWLKIFEHFKHLKHLTTLILKFNKKNDKK